jgi:hypothetical protein
MWMDSRNSKTVEPKVADRMKTQGKLSGQKGRNTRGRSETAARAKRIIDGSGRARPRRTGRNRKERSARMDERSKNERCARSERTHDRTRDLERLRSKLTSPCPGTPTTPTSSCAAVREHSTSGRSTSTRPNGGPIRALPTIGRPRTERRGDGGRRGAGLRPLRPASRTRSGRGPPRPTPARPLGRGRSADRCEQAPTKLPGPLPDPGARPAPALAGRGAVSSQTVGEAAADARALARRKFSVPEVVLPQPT